MINTTCNKSSVKTKFNSLIDFFATRAGLILVFFVIPLLIFYFALTTFYSSAYKTQREEALTKMSREVAKLSLNSNNEKYLHNLLSSMVAYANYIDSFRNQEKARLPYFDPVAGKVENIPENYSAKFDPYLYLKANLLRLKKIYGDELSFVLWDSEGNEDYDLSERAFTSVKKILFSLLHKISEVVKEDEKTAIQDLPFAKGREWRLVSKFLGTLLVPENLKKPLLKSAQAGPLMVDFGTKKSYVWYSANSFGTFICFTSSDWVASRTGLKKMVKKTNEKQEDFIFTYSETPATYKSIIDIATDAATAVEVASMNVFPGSSGEFENEEWLVYSVSPEPSVRVFALWKKASQHHVARRIRIVFKFFAFGLAIFFLVAVMFFRVVKPFFSLKWQLAVVFMLANILLLTLLMAFSNKFFLSKKEALIDEEYLNALSVLTDYEMSYDAHAGKLGNYLNEILNPYVKEAAVGELHPETLMNVIPDIAKTKPKQYLLVTHLGEVVAYESIGTGFESEHTKTLLLNVANTVMEHVNGNASSVDSKGLSSMLFDEKFRGGLTSYLGEVREMTLLDEIQVYYFKLFGSDKRKDIRYTFGAFWEKVYYQNLYLTSTFDDLAERLGAGLLVSSKDGKYSFSKNIPEGMDSYLLSLQNTAAAVKDLFSHRGEEYFVIREFGKSLVDFSFLMVFPVKKIYKPLNKLYIYIFLAALISVVLTLIVIRLLSANFLVPIANLKDATLAIDRQDFRHKIKIIDKDEFGHLSEVYNYVIEEMGDLAIAANVQENLFPENNFSFGDYDVFGKSVVLTTLAGDYYDIFPVDDEHAAIMIGDVAGHGVSAGLLMAMAKAAVLGAPQDEILEPEKLVSRLFYMFAAIKDSKLKRMMTFQYYILNYKKHTLAYCNAGHCYPAIVSRGKKEVRMIEKGSLPLGVGRKARYTTDYLQLDEGESLILYTDGIVEAEHNGEQYGYERFKKLLIRVADDNPAKFYENIYAGYEDWSDEENDDLTLIVVNRK
ncbi:MAG: SpoIIE family protein phosphatase [Candidatus Riflebacteria bacterium]|nr:SpoIIE family protein phosphatase [Candidatus Riflebacteria bacterium]